MKKAILLTCILAAASFMLFGCAMDARPVVALEGESPAKSPAQTPANSPVPSEQPTETGGASPSAKGELDISARGEASIRVTPDYATLSVAVISSAKTAAEVAQANRSAVASVFRVASEKVESSGHVSTGNYTISQDSGSFTAKTVLHVRVEKTDDLPALIDALIAAGASNIEEITYGLNDPQKAHDEALEAALDDAGQNARQIAGKYGLTLAELLSVAAEASPQSSSTSEIELHVAVTARYAAR